MKKLLLLFLFGLILNNTFAQFDRNFRKVSVDSINARTEFVYINDNVFYKDTLLSDYITFYAAGDVVNFGSANQVPFMNATGTDLGYSSNFEFNGNIFTLKSNVGTDNLFIGYDNIANSITTGNQNLFIGKASGESLTSGSLNIFLGQNTGNANNGSNNVFVGQNSGNTNTGSFNLFAGYAAGFGTVAASNNVYLGRNAGVNNTSGDGNIFIGYNAGTSTTSSNTLIIENSNNILTPLIYGEFDNNLVKINGDFKVQDDTLEVTADTTYIRNKLKVTGGAIYLDGRTITPATASAYIETGDEAATTISIADTYYFLKGTFTNKDAYNFAFDGDTLQYVGTDSIHVVLHYTCTFGVGQVNTKVTTGVSINDVIAPQSLMERSISATTDRGSWAGLATLTLGTNDKIKLVVKADKTGTVTAYRFSTIIKN